MNHCIILIGSNVEPYMSLKATLQALLVIDPALCALPEALTPAAGDNEKSPYMNQLVSLKTVLSATELTEQFKALEGALGRTPAHKAQGIVLIDIDLVYFNDELLKPFEATLPYVQEGMKKILLRLT